MTQPAARAIPSVAAKLWLLASLLLCLLVSLSFLRAADPPAQRGQTQAEVRQRLGPPARVSRQILFRRHVEQWVYEEPRPVRVEFNCVRGSS
jgi:hypothetical protein